MKISENIITILANLITGDTKISPYKTGQQLVDFFNSIGSSDVYENFPSRNKYVIQKIKSLNGSENLRKMFEVFLDPREFLKANLDITNVINEVNQYVRFDGYEIIKSGNFYIVRDLRGTLVNLETPFQTSREINHAFIEEQIQKCDRKIAESDFYGAITNARSLLEAVFTEVESRFEEKLKHDGDLPKQYRRVQKLLQLDPAQSDNPEGLRQTLQGLSAVVAGLANLRNQMSDAHAPGYKPSQLHARLAVNAAKTVSDFVLETLQEKKPIINS